MDFLFKFRCEAIVLIFLAIMSACNNSFDSQEENVPNHANTAQIIVNIPSKKYIQHPVHGSLKEPQPSHEGDITRGIIMVFRGDTPSSQLDVKTSFDFSSGPGYPIRLNVTEGMRYVYVVANVDPSLYGKVTQLSDIYNSAMKCDLKTLYVNKGVALPMSGMDSVDASQSTTSNPVQLTIQLNYIAAKVHIDWNSDLEGLVVSRAYILNSRFFSDYFAPSDSLSLTRNYPRFLYGRDDVSQFTSGKYYPHTPSTNESYMSLQIKDIKTDKGFDNNYFYLFENDMKLIKSPTIVVIEATYLSKKYYYPVVINQTPEGNSDTKDYRVVRGNEYCILANIHSLGNTNPYDEISSNKLTVTILRKELPR